MEEGGDYEENESDEEEVEMTGPLEGKICASAAGKSLAVSEETERSMRVSWMPAPGKVAHYRLKYSPIGGGKEMFLKVPGTSSSTVMKRLQPTTTYTITITPSTSEGKEKQGKDFWSIIQPSDRTAHRRNTKHPKQDV
ncbi:hypothetical protein OYC64_004769 [Pagothenia borchgrevinki]|uniref:Fibronectin type-III domain-containing protein n=1 Tax=Pagothenia borchgrevinki TaxID=8213 RepID=A0ABD2GDG2_PAGBO